MSDEEHLKNAKKAYEHAWSETKTAGDEMLHALNMADLVVSKTSRELFQRKADRAFVAYENWRKSADLAIKVIHDIVSKT